MPRAIHSAIRIAVITAALGQCCAAADDAPRYNRDVRPILAENCFRCHGPDSAARKADLRLDQRDVAIQIGAFEPGKPEASELVRRINSTDADEMMPPPAAHKTLSAAQKETLKRWIAAGAEYEPHWSLIAPRKQPPPVVKNDAWIRTPIDRFILAKLESLGLSPAAEADRRTLARRASLDLTGLPPDPAEVEKFASDSSSDAYEKYVDHLLQLPAWGEHRARYWLDLARYADTNGIHFDNYRENWAFRDYVIAAFNDNMPFDKFTVDQIAGDLLPNRTLREQVASGFNRCNMTTNEGGAINEEYLVLYARDRTETTAEVWLGLTVGCAVCHDHKFDPLSQKEFYQLSAFFNNTTQAAMDGNVKDTPPVVTVPRTEDTARWEALPAEIRTLGKKLAERKQTARGDFESWLASSASESIGDGPRDNMVLRVPLDDGVGGELKVCSDGKQDQSAPAVDLAWEDGIVGRFAPKISADQPIEIPAAGDREKDDPYTVAAWVKLAADKQSGAIVARNDDRHEFRGWDLWLENGRPGAHIIHAWEQDALKVVANNTLPGRKWNHVVATYDGSGKASGLKIYVNGARQPATVAADRLKHTIRTDVPLRIGQRETSAELDGASIQDVRLYRRALGDAEIAQLAADSRAAWLVKIPAGQRSDSQHQELFDWWLATLDKPAQQTKAQIAALQKEQADIKARGTAAHVMQERSGTPTAYVLNRGEYDQRRDQVTADTPKLLPPLPADVPHNRLGLAKWIVAPENPLTARVAVNQFWQEVFGTGIVRTTGDFGVSGELPSHAELLDWLAVDFRESGWDVKRLFRMLVTSAAYRQSAAVTPEKLAADPQNRLLSRGPRFRMDAEMVRDYALASSGLLVRKIGGPSVKPYQPAGVWEAVAMRESNTREYKQDHGENLYRRSLYTFWKRAAPPVSMEILNAPTRETCTVRRDRTDTPLQALVTLNDPQFVEAARALAQAAALRDGSADDRLQFVASRLLARPFRAEELALLKSSLIDQLSYFAAHNDEAQKIISVGESKPDPRVAPPVLAAWTSVCNELLNLDEALNK